MFNDRKSKKDHNLLLKGNVLSPFCMTISRRMPSFFFPLLGCRPTPLNSRFENNVMVVEPMIRRFQNMATTFMISISGFTFTSSANLLMTTTYGEPCLFHKRMTEKMSSSHVHRRVHDKRTISDCLP